MTSSRRTSSQKNIASKDDGAVEGHIHTIATRIQELEGARALAYPRIQHEDKPMRIPEFREKYKHVTTESPGDEVVTLRGMQLLPLTLERLHSSLHGLQGASIT
jgi:lysyl-tRNA synthetase class 2